MKDETAESAPATDRHKSSEFGAARDAPQGEDRAEPNERLAGCLHLAILSLQASLLGSAMAAVIVSLSEGKEGSWAILFPVFIFFFGIWIAVPVGWILGIPMLAATRRFLPRYLVAATLLFATIGLLGGWALDPSFGQGMGNVCLVFGACVAGMHPLVYGRANGARWRSIAAALLLSGLVVPSAAYAAESVLDMIDSRREYLERCADRYDTMAVVADRARLEQRRWHRDLGQGRWYRQGRGSSLYAFSSWIPLDETRILIARDYAYVPSGFAGWITGGRRVERHCLSEKRDGDAPLLRRHGVGRRPTLADLED